MGRGSGCCATPASVTSHKRVAETEPGMLQITVDEVVAAALELLGVLNLGRSDKIVYSRDEGCAE
jgi:hypothetical protein